MNADVPAVLSASAGAIPTLLLALVLQGPLLTALARFSSFSRDAYAALERNRLTAVLLTIAPTSRIARDFDYLVICVGGFGIISSVALQAVPDEEWGDGGTWEPWADLVLWFHLGVVATLALVVSAGLLALTKGARAAASGTAPTGSGGATEARDEPGGSNDDR